MLKQIIEDSYKDNKIDYEILKVAVDFLIDHDQLEKANALKYIIDNKKIPLLKGVAWQLVVGSKYSDYQKEDNFLPADLFSPLDPYCTSFIQSPSYTNAILQAILLYETRIKINEYKIT